MKLNRKLIIFGVFTVAIIMGALSMQRSMPGHKEDRIYQEILVYSPYKMEKRMGGLEILDKRDGRKEKPSNAEVFHRMDELEQEWGKQHLRIVGSDLHIIGENNQTMVKIFIETPKEKEFLHTFYGI
jgi:hypothetical protein